MSRGSEVSQAAEAQTQEPKWWAVTLFGEDSCFVVYATSEGEAIGLASKTMGVDRQPTFHCRPHSDEAQSHFTQIFGTERRAVRVNPFLEDQEK